MTAELLKSANALCHLLSLEFFAGTLRYTDYDIDLWYDGDRYSALGMDIGDVRFELTPEVDSVKIRLPNIENMFTPYVLDTDPRGTHVTIRLAALSQEADDRLPLATILSAGIIFAGEIDETEMDARQVVFDIASPFVRWRRRLPKRKYQPSCPLEFKSARCGYSGAATWCDQSYARCLELSNSANYRGYRFVPSLANKQIWWGRTGSGS